jgi:hypothetical protein
LALSHSDPLGVARTGTLYDFSFSRGLVLGCCFRQVVVQKLQQQHLPVGTSLFMPVRYLYDVL